jgi:hypothetical protein
MLTTTRAARLNYKTSYKQSWLYQQSYKHYCLYLCSIFLILFICGLVFTVVYMWRYICLKLDWILQASFKFSLWKCFD